MTMTWTQPQDYRTRPVTVLGGGVLGRRIGTPPAPLPNGEDTNKQPASGLLPATLLKSTTPAPNSAQQR